MISQQAELKDIRSFPMGASGVMQETQMYNIGVLGHIFMKNVLFNFYLESNIA